MEESAGQKPESAAVGEGKKKKLKRILLPLILVLLAGGGYFGWQYIQDGNDYFTTDNARVTAQMYPVVAPAAGKILVRDVNVGDRIVAEQVLGRTEALPYITAPAGGTVVRNDGALNQMVSVGSSLAIIADTDNPYIGVNIEETDISKIMVGQSVDISIDAYPKRMLSGRVTEINPATQTYFSGASSFSTSGTYTKVTQLIPVKVKMDNYDNLPLLFGMNATVKIHLR